MSGRDDIERDRAIVTRSPIAKHSMNQQRLGFERDGDRKLFGIDTKLARREARKKLGTDIRQAAEQSASALLNGDVSTVHVVTVLSLLPEIEEHRERRVNTETGTDITITIVDFST